MLDFLVLTDSVPALSGAGTPVKFGLLAHARRFCDFFLFRGIN
jgi:hypothetical protein